MQLCTHISKSLVTLRGQFSTSIVVDDMGALIDIDKNIFKNRGSANSKILRVFRVWYELDRTLSYASILFLRKQI